MMDKLTVLLIDSHKDSLDGLQKGLKRSDYLILTTSSRNKAIELINTRGIDIVVTELNLKDGTGLEILRYLQENKPEIFTLVMAAFGSVETAVEALRMGAYDYIIKPIRIAKLKQLLDRTAETILLRRENEQLRRILESEPGAPLLIGLSEKFKKVVDFIKQIAPSRSTVLITGESGTGKELAALAIHYYSKRAAKPFVKVNCGAIPETLFESELFGYEKGAFTGATGRKKGKIELAEGGTVFLDEIGDMPLSTQVKILRILQNREFERLGGTDTLKVNVRIIAATNTNLEQRVANRQFREDLYYRLDVISLTMPPLRERPEDIPFLAQFFIDKYNQLNEKHVLGIDPVALKQMCSHPWKGNIRELENTIERAVVLSQHVILPPQLFPNLDVEHSWQAQKFNLEIGMSLQQIEKTAIERTLQYHKFNKNRTAKTLQIGLATLYRKLKEYGLDKK